MVGGMTSAPALPYNSYSNASTGSFSGYGPFSVPARHNPRLQALVERINADDELRQFWRCANITAVERLGLSDHGETHVRIVANASLRLLRLLLDAGQPASLVHHHGLLREDAEVAVVLAAALHDLGLAVHYERHHEFGLALIPSKARDLLTGLYPVRDRTTLIAEVMHAVATHFNGLKCLTLEAGVLRIADTLDMTRGRSRTPDRALAAAIEEVTLHRSAVRAVRIEIRMNHESGLAHAEELLGQRLPQTGLSEHLEIIARIENASAHRGHERRLIPLCVPPPSRPA